MQLSHLLLDRPNLGHDGVILDGPSLRRGNLTSLTSFGDGRRDRLCPGRRAADPVGKNISAISAKLGLVEGQAIDRRVHAVLIYLNQKG